MGNKDVRKISYIIEKNDDDKKEIYLKELGDSLHNYIKTGIKNEQLDDLIELEEVFQEKYEERFDVEKMVESISQSSKGKVTEIEKVYIQELNNKMKEEKAFNFSIEQVSAQIISTVVDDLCDILQKVVKDTAYLSHINMLYELYEQEEQLRREEQEYDSISREYQKMADISRKLSKQRRMEIEQLERQVDISQDELLNLLSQNDKYFNIRERQENIQISLSPQGRKYYDYIMNSQKKYSQETLNQLVYKNCNSIMESLENSYDRGIEFELKLDEIPPERERALQFNYHRITEKFISEIEDDYTARNYIIKEKKERTHTSNEKNRIRIPKAWDSEND
ncbi:hypothetical protein AALC16_10360 [Lachnospiraceae bacterium 29-91]